MKNYEDMSDFEINVAVFEAIHNGSPDYKEGENGDMVLVSFDGDIVNGDAVEVEVEHGSFNPCANPSDAEPIIVENRIGIIPAPENGLWKAAHRKVGSDSNPYHMTQDENPLRAAMIVFLKMNEDKL